MKLYNYIIIMVTMMVILELVGISTGFGQTLSLIGIDINPTNGSVTSVDVHGSKLFDVFFGNLNGLFALTLAAAGSIVVGLLGKYYDTNLLILPAVIWVATTFVGTFGSLMILALNSHQNWFVGIVCTIFVPLQIGFLMAAVDWFGGDR